MNIFSINKCSFGYYIQLYKLQKDKIIATKLGISLQKYINILKQFNAYFEKENEEYFFKNYNDVNNCIFYLKEKYGVILKLVGE